MQQILDRTELVPAIDRCFAAEAGALRSLWTADDREAGTIVQAAFINPSRREAWRNGFRCLGADAEVRMAYDRFAFDSDRWFRPAVRRLYSIPLPAGLYTPMLHLPVDTLPDIDAGHAIIQW